MRNDMRTFLFVFGTRPEAIKLAPVIKAFQREPECQVKVCTTAQHREMLDQVLSFFDIATDIDLNLMKPNQSLFSISAHAVMEMENVLNELKPDFLVVQGDTTTAYCAALAGYYMKTNVVHVEAGLRSHDKYSPYPEEINRTLIAHIADFHFAPTEAAKDNLLNEGVKKNIYVVGNTIVDALSLTLDNIKTRAMEKEIHDYFGSLIPHFEEFVPSENAAPAKLKRLILVTGHRRESFGETFRNICKAIRQLAVNNRDVHFVYPVHMNPNVIAPVQEILSSIPNIHLIKPLSYPHLVWLMAHAYLILTDSGGIQEEAPSLHKPVLVMREVTERWEGILAGAAKLVGTSEQKIVEETTSLLHHTDEYQKMTTCSNPYGDGKTAERILEYLKRTIQEEIFIP